MSPRGCPCCRGRGIATEWHCCRSLEAMVGRAKGVPARTIPGPRPVELASAIPRLGASTPCLLFVSDACYLVHRFQVQTGCMPIVSMVCSASAIFVSIVPTTKSKPPTIQKHEETYGERQSSCTQSYGVLQSSATLCGTTTCRARWQEETSKAYDCEPG